jgi:hypothetical protein
MDKRGRTTPEIETGHQWPSMAFAEIFRESIISQINLSDQEGKVNKIQSHGSNI